MEQSKDTAHGVRSSVERSDELIALKRQVQELQISLNAAQARLPSLAAERAMEREKALESELALLKKSFNDQLLELSQLREQKETEESAHIAQLRDHEQMWNAKCDTLQRALKSETESKQQVHMKMQELMHENVCVNIHQCVNDTGHLKRTSSCE